MNERLLLSLFLFFQIYLLPTFAQDASVSGEKVWCSPAVAGSQESVSITCTGLNPKIINNLISQIQTELRKNRISTEKAISDANARIEKYLDYRQRLENSNIADEGKLREAWEQLQSGMFDRLESILGPIASMSSKLDRMESKMELSVAVSILNKATQGKDGSMQGQVEAIEVLLAREHTYENADLSGISLRGANLSGSNFRAAKLHAVDLSMVEGIGINLTESGLRFAILDHGKFDTGDLSKIYAPFVSGKTASFKDSNLSEANFFSADLQKANFKGANLRGTSFAFADLRGANFDEANLTGAYFPGAVLDGASFKNAVMKDTEFIGASTRNLEISKIQLKGVCRHNIFGLKDDGFLEWDVRLIEKWESNKYSTGYDFDEILNSGWGFNNFSDRSLPLCKTPPDLPTGHDSAFPASESMHLNRSYMVKANRRAQFRKRVEGHVKFLAASLSKKHNLIGDGNQIKEWHSFILQKFNSTKIISEPYINTDLALVILLKAGLINVEKTNWKQMARLRYTFEANIRKQYNGKFSLHSMWEPIFPHDIPWENLPENVGELYRNWAQKRSKNSPNKVIFKPPFYVKPNSDVASLKTGYLFRTPEGLTTSNSWPSWSTTAVKNKVKDLGKTKFLPIKLYDTGIKRALFVFPERYDSYTVVLPKSLIKQYEIKHHIAGDVEIEMDLLIEKIALVGKRNPVVLIYVIPDEVRLTKKAETIWSGMLNF